MNAQLLGPTILAPSLPTELLTQLKPQPGRLGDYFVKGLPIDGPGMNESSPWNEPSCIT